MSLEYDKLLLKQSLGNDASVTPWTYLLLIKKEPALSSDSLLSEFYLIST